MSEQDKYNKMMFPPSNNDSENEQADTNGQQPDKRAKAALTHAHEIRKFEIELYWKRALYFWGFEIVFITLFSAILTQYNPDDHFLFFLPVVVGGLCVTIAWFYIAKGSKAWQENWEKHIDFLEEHITGNLYKTVIGEKENFYSVSKINKAVIVLFGIFWVVVLVIIAADCYDLLSEKLISCSVFLLIISVLLCFGFWVYIHWRCNTNFATDDTGLRLRKKKFK